MYPQDILKILRNIMNKKEKIYFATVMLNVNLSLPRVSYETSLWAHLGVSIIWLSKLRKHTLPVSGIMAWDPWLNK